MHMILKHLAFSVIQLLVLYTVDKGAWMARWPDGPTMGRKGMADAVRTNIHT